MTFPIPPDQVSAVLPDNPAVRYCAWEGDFRGDTPHPGQPAVPSMYALLQRTAARYPLNEALGWRESDDEKAKFVYWTYQQMLDMTDALGRALASFGLKKGDRVGFYARNCPQWTLLQYACLSQGLVVVPIYDTLGPNIVEYVTNHAEVKVCLVSAANYAKLASVRDAGKCPVEKVVVVGMKDLVREEEVKACLGGEGVVDVVDLYESGLKMVKEGLYGDVSVDLDDLMVIMYTSGTTGDPKGVMLPHRAILASIGSAYMFFDHWGYGFGAEDVLLSYLPLSHIFEQQAEAMVIGGGGKIGFYSGDIKKLLNDMDALQPTVFAGVPRVYARFQQRIEENVENASFIQKTLFSWAYHRQVKAEENPGQVSRSGLWDALVFKKVRAKILPRCKVAITGSAPMSGQTNDFLKVCLQMPIVQGYGLTETVGGMVCSAPSKSKSGTCGGPLPGTLVKLKDLPEMGYLTSDKPYPRGEICVKGDIVFTGYYKNEEATKKSFDEDGFFMTGDVGQWREDGSLQIIDRAKNLFKLAQGEYVSPELLEQEYAKAKLVGQIFVYGNSLQATLLAVVVPDVIQAKAWGEGHGLNTLESVAAAPLFKKEMLAQLEEMRAKSNFKKYEAIKDVIVEVGDLNELGQGFHVGNDLMTPSFKLKRPQLRKKYQADLDALYGSN